MDHKWDGGALRCSNGCAEPRYALIIEQHVRGRLVGRIRIETCYRHDVGM
jgi:hypothetical protein